MKFHLRATGRHLSYEIAHDTGLGDSIVRLFTPQLSPVFIVPTHGGMARLS